MYFYEFVAQWLEEAAVPLMPQHELFIKVALAYRHQQQNPGLVRNPPKTFDDLVFRRTIRQLTRKRRVVIDEDFRGDVWQILAAPPAANAEDAICLVDPFARVAYLSAMERHGITNRSPKALQILTYSSPEWGIHRREKLKKDLPNDLLGTDFPMPFHVQHKKIVRRRPVDSHKSKHLGFAQSIRGGYGRITTIAQTFIDMIEQPALCGGIRHVIETWEKHGEEFLEEIIDAIDSPSVQKITKVRAGYLIDERMRTNNPTAMSWVRFTQRGGSQKLDPNAPYKNQFSEKWMLSINV